MTAPTVLSVPAQSALTNEDAVATGGGVVVVVDGAGIPPDLRAGCDHSVAWFARAVAATFHAQLAGRSSSMTDALAETIDLVAASHSTSCDVTKGSPSATVAAWRTTADQLDYLVLCDASVVLVDAQGNADTITDGRLGAVLDAASGSGGPGSPAGEHLLAKRRAAVEAARNTAGGFWCVHHDPLAATEAIEGRVPLRTLSGAVACSDGATRAYEVLGTHTAASFAATALHGDQDALVESIRNAEIAQAADLRRQGLKLHDDLTFVAHHADTLRV